MKKGISNPAHPERVCWGCDRYCAADDLACGNGALSHRLVEGCAALVGVDLSPYLIQIANQHFAQAPRVSFFADGAAQYLRAEATPERFTKVLCYGSFAYFSDEDASQDAPVFAVGRLALKRRPAIAMINQPRITQTPQN